MVYQKLFWGRVSKTLLGKGRETFPLFCSSLELARSQRGQPPKQQGPECVCLTNQEKVFMDVQHADAKSWFSKGSWELSKRIRTVRKMESNRGAMCRMGRF